LIFMDISGVIDGFDSYPQRHESRSEEEKREELLKRRASV